MKNKNELQKVIKNHLIAGAAAAVVGCDDCCVAKDQTSSLIKLEQTKREKKLSQIFRLFPQEIDRCMQPHLLNDKKNRNIISSKWW